MYLHRRDEQAVSSGEQSTGWGAAQITIGVVGFSLAFCLLALIYFRERLLRAARRQIVLWEEVYAKARSVNTEIMEDNELFRQGLRYYMDREKQEEAARGLPKPSRHDPENDTHTPEDDSQFSVGSESDSDPTESAPEAKPDVYRSPGRKVRPGEVKVVEITAKESEQVEVSAEQSNTATPSELKVELTNQAPQIPSSSTVLRGRHCLADELRDSGYDSQHNYPSSSSGTCGSPMQPS